MRPGAWQTGVNAKIHRVTMTFVYHGSTIVHAPQNLFTSRTSFINGMISGTGTEFIDPTHRATNVWENKHYTHSGDAGSMVLLAFNTQRRGLNAGPPSNIRITSFYNRDANSAVDDRTRRLDFEDLNTMMNGFDADGYCEASYDVADLLVTAPNKDSFAGPHQIHNAVYRKTTADNSLDANALPISRTIVPTEGGKGHWKVAYSGCERERRGEIPRSGAVRVITQAR
jgi:hypothetical protein